MCVACGLLMALPTMAQGENDVLNTNVGELSYTVKEQEKTNLGTVVGAVLDVLAEQTKTEQPGYVDAVRASVIMALGNVRRMSVTDGLQVEPNSDTYTPEQMNFRYRGSLLSGTDDFLLSAAFRTAGCDPVEIRDRMAAFAVRRRAAQPLDLPSLGSFFKRPPDRSAAALIDECGLKGLTIGGAAVSGKHAGFLVNRGGATAADLIALAALVRERVFDRFHVLLEPEAEIVP